MQQEKRIVALQENIHFGIDMPQAIETQLLFRNDARTPLGRLTTVAGRTSEIGRFLHVLTDIVAPSSSESPVALEPLWLAHACTLLEAELTQDIDVRAVACAVGIPHETFRKRFQQHIGVSPARYRAIRRIDAAYAMLQQPGPTTRMIAASLGFSDEFHSWRRFKQITGMSPREFRRLLPHAADGAQ